MRQLLFVVALTCALGFARVADAQALKTNDISLGKHGTLQVLTPPDWTMAYTNLGLLEKPVTFELHAPSNSIVMRFYVRWDGFGGKPIAPTEADFSNIVSNNVATQYFPTSVEKTVNLEKLTGPNVAGVYSRITDANWTPIRKNDYPNLVEGMFRSANIWGNFNVLMFDKDGPQFKAALRVLQSLRRKP